MAKKNFGSLENNNKNIGNGVNALLKSTTAHIDAVTDENYKEEIELSNYPLRMPKTMLKALKTIAIEKDTSVKEIIITAIQSKYNL